jgi:hypothetical protein
MFLIFIFFLSPLLTLYWEKVLERKRSMDGLIKIAIGFLLTSVSFIMLALACIQGQEMVSLFWVVVAILIQTLGELWIVPIGFSNISKLAPPRFRSVMMSFWPLYRGIYCPIFHKRIINWRNFIGPLPNVFLESCSYAVLFRDRSALLLLWFPR